MKKKVLILTSLITFVLIAIVTLFYSDNDKVIYESESISDNRIVSFNALTMMYETDYQSGEYQVSTETTWPQEGYVFNETLSKCENGGVLTWDAENKKILLQTNTSDKCYVYFDKEPDIIYLADYIVNNVYTGIDGENNLYLHDGLGSYANANLEAGDNSYRYSGANPNNYVCFGSDETSCSNDNLYRIIGVFEGQIKLIIRDYAREIVLGRAPAGIMSFKSYPYYKGNWASLPYYYWNESNSNVWNSSTLNMNILNGTYLNTLGSAWSSKIAEHAWQVGGNESTSIFNVPVRTAYINEIVSQTEATKYSAKIGLMYVSDYGYAASPENWNTNMESLNNDTNRNNNWMFMGYNDWTITSRLDATNTAFCVGNTGNVSYDYISYGREGVRPSFYLNTDVTYVSGSGTISDPFRIS